MVWLQACLVSLIHTCPFPITQILMVSICLDPFLEIKLAFSRVVSAAKSYYVEDTAEYENLLKKFSSTLATTKSPKMEPLAAS